MPPIEPELTKQKTVFGLEEPMHDKDDTQEPSKTGYEKIREIITTIIAILILAILGGYLIVYLTAPLH